MRAYGPTDEIPSKLLTQIGHRSSTYYSDKVAARYRQNDLREHISAKTWGKTISRVASSLPGKISVLDLGCGTGRYFHCIKNAGLYIGVDASLAMLELAKKPIKRDEITAGTIYLLQAEIYNLALRPGSFDFIFSIGVLGDHIPLTLQFCSSLRSLLRPGGKALFTVMDAKTPHSEGGWKRKLALTIYPLLFKSLKSRIDVRIANFTHTEEEVKVILANSGFGSYRISHSLDEDPNRQIWDRYWFICEARK